MKRKILLLIVFSPIILQGQNLFPFRYRISSEMVPDEVKVVYKEKEAIGDVVYDSIKLVVVDSLYEPSIFHSFVIISDTEYYIYLFDTNRIMIRYCTDFQIGLQREREYYNVKDTGVSHRITQIIYTIGRHNLCWRTIYSKIPLSRKKIRSIKEYVYDKGPEPMCIKRKNCWIGLPEI